MKRLFLLLLLFMFHFSCFIGGDEDNESITSQTPSTVRSFGETTVSGKVRYADGVVIDASLQGLKVNLMVDLDGDGNYDVASGDISYSVLTDSRGYFRFYNVKVPKEGTRTLITVQASGFLPFSKEFFIFPEISLSIPDIKLEPASSITLDFSKSNRSGGPIWVLYKDNGNITALEGIRAPEVNTLNGTRMAIKIDPARVPEDVTSLTITMRAFDSTDTEEIEYFPGDFRGEDPNGKLPEVDLESVMFSFIDMRDQNGNFVTLKDEENRDSRNPCEGDIYFFVSGKALERLRSIGDLEPKKPGCQIPNYTYLSTDKKAGRWIYTGSLTLCKFQPDGSVVLADCNSSRQDDGYEFTYYESFSWSDLIKLLMSSANWKFFELRVMSNNLDAASSDIFGGLGRVIFGSEEDCDYWRKLANQGNLAALDYYRENCVPKILGSEEVEGGGGEGGVIYVPTIKYKLLFKVKDKEGNPMSAMIAVKGEALNNSKYTNQEGEALVAVSKTISNEKDVRLDCESAKDYLKRKNIKLYVRFSPTWQPAIPLDIDRFREPTEEERKEYGLLSCAYDIVWGENTTTVTVVAQDKEGNPIPDRRVCISDNNLFITCKKTGGDGTAIFDYIVPNNYTVFGEHLKAVSYIVEDDRENRVVLHEGNNPPELSFRPIREQVPGSIWVLPQDTKVEFIVWARDLDGDPLRIVSVKCDEIDGTFDSDSYLGSIPEDLHAYCPLNYDEIGNSLRVKMTVSDGEEDATIERQFSVIKVSRSMPMLLGYQIRPVESGLYLYKDPYGKEELYYSGSYRLFFILKDGVAVKVDLDNKNCSRDGDKSFTCSFSPGTYTISGKLVKGSLSVPFKSFTLKFTDNFPPHILRLSIPKRSLGDEDSLIVRSLIYDAEKDRLGIKLFSGERVLKESVCSPDANGFCLVELIVPSETIPSGNQTLRLQVTDGKEGHVDSEEFSVEVKKERPFFKKPLPSQTVSVSVGGSYTFTVEVEDPNGDPLQYEWFINGKKVFSGAPTFTYTFDQPGVYTVEVKVSDGKNTVSSVAHVTVEGAAVGLKVYTGFEGVKVILLDDEFRPVDVKVSDASGVVQFDYVNSPVNVAFHLDARKIVVPKWLAFSYELWSYAYAEMDLSMAWLWLVRGCRADLGCNLSDLNHDGISTPDEVYQSALDFVNQYYPEDGGKYFLSRLIGKENVITVVISRLKPGEHNLSNFVRRAVLSIIFPSSWCGLYKGELFDGSEGHYTFFRAAYLNSKREVVLKSNHDLSCSLVGAGGFSWVRGINEFGTLLYFPDEQNQIHLLTSSDIPLILLGCDKYYWLPLTSENTYNLSAVSSIELLSYGGVVDFEGDENELKNGRVFKVYSSYRGNVYDLGYKETFSRNEEGKLNVNVTVVPPYDGAQDARVLVRYVESSVENRYKHYVDKILSPQLFLSELNSEDFLYTVQMSNYSSRKIELSATPDTENLSIELSGEDLSKVNDVFFGKEISGNNGFFYRICYFGSLPKDGRWELNLDRLLPEDVYQEVYALIQKFTEKRSETVLGPVVARSCEVYDPGVGVEPYSENCSWFLTNVLWRRTCQQYSDQFQGLALQSLALDGDGKPHVVYSLGSIYHAYKNNNQWEVEEIEAGIEDGVKVADVGLYPVITTDIEGNLHVFYVVDNVLKHAWKEGSVWVKEDIDEGVNGRISAVIDSTGGIHVVYETRTGDVKYGYLGSNGWKLEVLGKGKEPFVAVNSLANPHVVFFDNSSRKILYAVKTEDGWTMDTVAEGVTLKYSSLSLSLNSNGVPGVVFSTPGTGQCYTQLKYAYLENGSWKLDDVACNAAYPSVRFGSNDKPIIVYDNPWTTEGIVVAFIENGEWKVERVSDTEICDWGEISVPSIVVNSEGKEGILYYNCKNKKLKYLFRSASGWIEEDSVEIPESYSYKVCLEY